MMIFGTMYNDQQRSALDPSDLGDGEDEDTM